MSDPHVRGAEPLDVDGILAGEGLSREGGELVVDAERDGAASTSRERASGETDASHDHPTAEE